MRPEEWSPLCVTGWRRKSFDSRGLREKFWIAADSEDTVTYLRKLPRERSPFEPAIEHTALSLAHLCELPAADGVPCFWEEESGAIRRGIAVQNFLRPGEELSPGAEVVHGHDESFDPDDARAHTTARVRSALMAREGVAKTDLVRPLTEMLLFDAWIGNGDRHSANWGLARGTDRERLAPMFDLAACLGAELHDGHAVFGCEPHRLARYAKECPSGFGNRERLLKLREVVDELREWPEWANAAPRCLARFGQALPIISAYIESIPDDWLPARHRLLAKELLRHRLEWLTEEVGNHD